MSALRHIPGYVVDAIRAPTGHPSRRGMREDLLLIPAAEAAGWVVSFPNDRWHDSATFARGSDRVWSTGYNWRRAVLGNDGRFGPPAVFRELRDALALAGEG